MKWATPLQTPLRSCSQAPLGGGAPSFPEPSQKPHQAPLGGWAVSRDPSGRAASLGRGGSCGGSGLLSPALVLPPSPQRQGLGEPSRNGGAGTDAAQARADSRAGSGHARAGPREHAEPATSSRAQTRRFARPGQPAGREGPPRPDPAWCDAGAHRARTGGDQGPGRPPPAPDP